MNVYTVRVREDWLEKSIQELGGSSALAERLGCSPSTISRHLSGKAEAGPRFIGAVLALYPASFSEAFEVVEEPAVHRVQMVKAITRRRPALSS